MSYITASRLLYGQWVAQIARLDSNNYPVGTLASPDSPTHATSYNPYVIPALVSYAPASDTYQEVSSYANMKLRGKVALPLTDFGIGTLTLSELDDVFDPLVMGYANDVATATSLRIRARNSGRKTPRRFILMLTRASVDTNNVISYETIFYMNIMFRSGSLGTSQTVNQNPDPLAYSIIPAKSSRMPWGKVFTSTTNLVVDGNADSEISIQAPAPMMLSTWIDDSSTTTVVMPFAPDSNDHSGLTNIIYKQGIDNKANVSSLSGSTWTVTPGTDFDKWVFLCPSTALLTA